MTAFATACDDLRGRMLLAELPHDLVGSAIRREWNGLLPPLSEIDALIAAFYVRPGNSNGGKLHIVIENTNLGNDSIEWCISEAEQTGDPDVVALGRLLLALPMRVRVGLAHVCKCGCADEWLEPEMVTA